MNKNRKDTKKRNVYSGIVMRFPENHKEEDQKKPRYSIPKLNVDDIPDINEEELYFNRIPRSLNEVKVGAEIILKVCSDMQHVLRHESKGEMAFEDVVLYIKESLETIERILKHHGTLFRHIEDEFVSDSIVKLGCISGHSCTHLVYQRGGMLLSIMKAQFCDATKLEDRLTYETSELSLDDIFIDDKLKDINELMRMTNHLFGDLLPTHDQSCLLDLELKRAVRNRKLAGYAPSWDDFVKIDDPELVELENRHPNNITLRRDFYLHNRKNESYAELAKHWNELSEKARKEICPKRSGEVTTATVKKQLGRLRDNLRDMRSEREKKREF